MIVKINNETVDLIVKPCTYEAAKFACENYHYSKCLPSGRTLKYGVWEDEAFKGCIIYSLGANKHLGAQFNLVLGEVIELTRIALKSHKSFVTTIMKLSRDILKENCKELKLIISYADDGQNHLGKIYQADNWIYTGEQKGITAGQFFYKGKWHHHRTVTGLQDLKLRKQLIETLPSKNSSNKHKYLYPLNKKLKKELIKLSKPYPKIKTVIS